MSYAYLSLRLDEDAEARAALAKLRALDPEDRVGAAVLEAVRMRRERLGHDADEGEDDDSAPAATICGHSTPAPEEPCHG
ncbi:MAG TPA: hypothetical protein VK195_04720 [Burkholderiaceae bacterium]|nr:hypothetical protein [Burkholderiaceae bacterium]